MADQTDTPNMDLSEPLRRALGERYLTYALSTIMHRALPDARDGLKPVHRRILFAMRELRLSSTGGFRKSAKISGDVMGNYHPHGDAAIYDAMARLAQDFNVRYPLVDGQGNFGNIDGDNPAASRYTEARMTLVAEALLEGLNENAVDYRENYDGTLTEPVVLPAQFPNLLANGASGIAVGMATNIPPHNIAELCDACLHLIKKPDARDDTLLNYVPGPDFPTGGIIVEPPEAIAQAYRTGKGGFRLRCRYEVEDLGRGQWQIVVTEIPYQVQKSKLIEKLAEVIQTKKVPILADVRDESADDIRLILEPRSKNVDPDVLMGMLYRNSDLEVRFSLNMNVLIDGVTPKVCSMKEVLRAFLDFRREVLIRRSQHRMEKIDHRLEVLEGLIVAFLNLDRVIDIIRYDDDPKAALMREDWGKDHARAMSEADYIPPAPGEGELSEVQVEAILNMRLRSLRRLEEMELLREQAELMEERAGLEDLLESEELQWQAIADQMRETKKKFGKDYDGGARRTTFAEAGEVEDVPIEAMIDREPITIVCSQMGWVRAMTGHIDLTRELKFKDGDGPRF
ncbi:MAG: DNA topoisomerase IV subunit A, partial [Tateyamaria sp.]